MTRDFSNPDVLHQWVLGEGPDFNSVEEQDTPWFVAESTRARDLLKVAELPGALPDRRDEILFCIGVRLEGLLDPQEPDPANVPSSERDGEIELLAQFVVAHRHDFVERSVNLGFGADHDSVVIPYIRNRFGQAGSDS